MSKEYLNREDLTRLLTLMKQEFGKYVKTVDGKGLSTNDFTDELLEKLNSLENTDVSALVEEYLAEHPPAPGKPGYTPQKGIDYYTEADKQELISVIKNDVPTVDDLLAALQTWEGGSY